MTEQKMDLRDPNPWDMLDPQLYVIPSTPKKILELYTVFEAPDTEAEIRTGYTNTFSGAAREAWTIQCVADVAGSLNDTSYHFSIATVRHYVWLNVNAAGTDPAHAGETGHEVALATNDNAATVAAAIQAVTDAIAGYSSDNSTDTNTEEVDAVGVAEDMADDTTDPTGFTFTKIIDGTAAYTANYFYLVSADAKDTAAGVGARTVRVFIIDADGAPNHTDVSMAGATIVKSSVTAIAIIGMRVLTAGTEGDAAGAITARDYLANDVYCTIAAGSNSSVSARCEVPDGWNGKILSLRSRVAEVNHATADIDPELGAILKVKIDGEESGIDDDTVHDFTVSNYQELYRTDLHEICTGYNGAYISLLHVTKADDKNTTLCTHVKYLIWKDV